MNIKVKKEIGPFLNINNKISYDIPNKSKGFYVLLKKQVSKKSHMEKYWTNLFPSWNIFYEKRIKYSENKKLADFHFKLIHKILPCQENLYDSSSLTNEKDHHYFLNSADGEFFDG